MLLTKEVEKRFPLCARYIQNFLSDPKAFQARYPVVWAAFLKACRSELSPSERNKADALAVQALTAGREPWVHLFDSATDCGVFHPGPTFFGYPTRDRIKVSTEVMDAYEHGPGWKVLESTILHELVHWIRFEAAGTGGFQSTNEGEIGERFEEWAYRARTCVRGPDGKLIPYGPPAGQAR